MTRKTLCCPVELFAPLNEQSVTSCTKIYLRLDAPSSYACRLIKFEAVTDCHHFNRFSVLLLDQTFHDATDS